MRWPWKRRRETVFEALSRTLGAGPFDFVQVERPGCGSQPNESTDPTDFSCHRDRVRPLRVINRSPRAFVGCEQDVVPAGMRKPIDCSADRAARIVGVYLLGFVVQVGSLVAGAEHDSPTRRAVRPARSRSCSRGLEHLGLALVSCDVSSLDRRDVRRADSLGSVEAACVGDRAFVEGLPLDPSSVVALRALGVETAAHAPAVRDAAFR